MTWFWAWGACGALWHGLQVVSRCIQDRLEIDRSCWPCYLELAVAVVCGTIAAAAFTPYLMVVLGQTTPEAGAALAALIGLAQKKLAPALARAFSSVIASMITKRPPGADDDP